MPTIYTSDDPGSPMLGGPNGAIKRVLKGILVDGYPGHAAAGWTMPYEASGGPAGDSDPGMFRSGAGTQQYYRVNDNFTFPFNQYTYTVSELATGINGADMTDIWGGGAHLAPRPDGAGPHKWIAFADARTCYL